MQVFVYFLMFFVFSTNAKKSGLLSANFYNKKSFLSFLKLDANTNITVRCPSNTIQLQFDNNICYLFVNELRSFDDAENFCNKNSGNLVIVPNQFVNQHISGTLSFHF